MLPIFFHNYYLLFIFLIFLKLFFVFAAVEINSIIQFLTNFFSSEFSIRQSFNCC